MGPELVLRPWISFIGSAQKSETGHGTSSEMETKIGSLDLIQNPSGQCLIP